MQKNAARTGLEVAGDVMQGRTFRDSAEKRVPTGIKRGVEDIMYQSTFVKRQIKTTKKKNSVIDVTSSCNGIRSRSAMLMYKVGVGSVFSATYAD